jgi:hypothetical protein
VFVERASSAKQKGHVARARPGLRAEEEMMRVTTYGILAGLGIVLGAVFAFLSLSGVLEALMSG